MAATDNDWQATGISVDRAMGVLERLRTEASFTYSVATENLSRLPTEDPLLHRHIVDARGRRDRAAEELAAIDKAIDALRAMAR